MQNVSVFSLPSYNLTGETVMIKDKKGRGVDTMSTMKPIQATPELSGKDAERLLSQADIAPTKKAMNKNNMLRGVLNNIRKA